MFGIVAFVINPVFLCTLIALLYGRKALRLGTVHRGRAIAGIVLGWVGVGTAVLAFLAGLALGALGHTLLDHRIESSITAAAASAGTTLTDVACPTPASPTAGDAMTCTADAAGVGPVGIDVVFASDRTFRITGMHRTA